MAKYLIPFVWQVSGYVEVEADSTSAAITEAYKNPVIPETVQVVDSQYDYDGIIIKTEGLIQNRIMNVR
mgnify:CR=1 FL=1